MLLLIAGFVLLRGKTRNEAENPPSVSSTSTPTVATRTLPPPEAFIPEIPEKLLDTSNWKTYTSEAYGFSIKYPKDWKVDEGEENDAEGGFVDFAPNHIDTL